MPTRVVVIGAGHHGLVAAVRLAEAGYEVLVLEASPRAGGGVRSAELTLPGFRHDTCAGFFPLAAASPVFRRLELGLDWVDPPIAMAHVLDEPGRAIALHRDLDAAGASLEQCAVGAGRAWRDLVGGDGQARLGSLGAGSLALAGGPRGRRGARGRWA